MIHKINYLSCTITATIIVYAAVAHYPFMQKTPDIWLENLHRTLAVFAWITFIELLTEIIIFATIDKGVKRLITFIFLILGWTITCVFVIPKHNSLGNNTWNTNTYNELLYWNWTRAVLWILRVIILF